MVSVQPNAPVDFDRDHLIQELGRLSLSQGIRILRLEGVASVRAFADQVPVIGLIKKHYAQSEVFITPTQLEVDALLQTKCEVIALDGTSRPRPEGAQLTDLIQCIHAAGKLAMADCDSFESAQYSAQCGADFIGTTLRGHTKETREISTPDIDLVFQVSKLGRPVIAEGGYAAKSHVECALKAGASAVVIGTAINDALLLTQKFMPTPRLQYAESDAKIGAVDIGGTWLRFGVFDAFGHMVSESKIPNPHNKVLCIEWIRARAAEAKVVKVGVSTGGVVDPATGTVWTAKENLMPDHIGICFSEESIGVPCVAWGDGHAAAWAHACMAPFSGKRVASIALGTGVGFGLVIENKIWSGKRGEYPRLNDQYAQGGASYEDLLGGIHLTKQPTSEQEYRANQALNSAVQLVTDLYFPDVIIVSGGVGCQPWIQAEVESAGAVISPFADRAGIQGAAALALYPPELP